MKFYLETYGCRVNQCESQAIAEAWERFGVQLVQEPAGADYVLINSCAITSRAERNARNALTRLRKLAPAARIILTGCAAQFYGDFTPRKDAPWTEPDICIVQGEKSRLLGGPELAATGEIFPFIHSCQRARPVVKIQDGCAQHCAYCIVPHTRGRPRSLSVDAIIAQCRTLAAQGFGELLISGINLRQYEGNFWHMAAMLENNLLQEFTHSLRLRLSSLDPAMLTDEAVAFLGQSRLFCPHLHLSLQHASPAVLARMGRAHYDLGQVVDQVGKLRKYWPVMGLGADILVGFPGETEADLEILLRFIERFPLTYAHVFPFSRRQGTKAWDMPGQLPRALKDERAKAVRASVSARQRAFLVRQLALDHVRVAVERRGGEVWQGVNEFYTPCHMARGGSMGFPLVSGRPVAITAGGLLLETLDA